MMISKIGIWTGIEKLIDSLDKPWETMVKLAFEGVGKEHLEATPGSSKGHQCYPMGYLEHSLEVGQIARDLGQIDSNKGADMSMVIGGALLHDIGKVWSYQLKLGGSYEYTSAEKTAHHIILGLEYLVKVRLENKAKLEGAGFGDAHWEALRHIVVSHHGIREQGALREPQTLEAMMVHLADMASARLDKIRNNPHI